MPGHSVQIVEWSIGIVMVVGQVRQPRSRGKSSRDKILDATSAIAGDHGYNGTSIKLVSERSGLPVSSIYWHFEDKDDLLGAAIERSRARFIEVLDQPFNNDPDAPLEAQFHAAMRHCGDAMTASADFVRLGLMLTLQGKPPRLIARKKFVEGRQVDRERAKGLCQGFFGDLESTQLDLLATLIMALVDGLFVASQAERIDLADTLDLAAAALLGAVDRIRAERPVKAATRATGRRRTTTPRLLPGSAS
jgi:AcrR family transcriptional regulator